MSINKIILSLADFFCDNRLIRFVFLPLYRKHTSRLSVNRRGDFIANSNDVFKSFDAALKELNCDYWLTFGTLLGAIRDNGFIKHDYDIDVGVLLEDRSEQMLEILQKYGFQRSRMIIVEDGKEAFEETFIKDNVSVDIFYFHKKTSQGLVYCYDFVNDPELTPRESMKRHGGFLVRRLTLPFGRLLPFNFLGVDVKIPSNYDKYLSSHYGNDYMEPNPNWNTMYSPIAVFMKGMVGRLYEYS